jgi:hypothetical protein
MPRLTIPSIQHLARHWRSDPRLITRTLVGLAKRPPNFSYGVVSVAARDLLAFHQPYDEVLEGIRRVEKRENILKNFMEILPLIDGYFKSVTPDAVNAIDAQTYNVGTRLKVPFRPPFLYVANGRLHLPWLSFWQSNPLAGVNLSLFATMIDDLVRNTPGLRGAKATLLDFSRPKPNVPRQLRLIALEGIPRIPNAEKLEMLATFAEAFFMAQQELSGAVPEADKKRDDRRSRDEERGDDLFRR